ncbi:sulfite exporter TauE/SafE family protein [Angustibacter aerolatus]
MTAHLLLVLAGLGAGFVGTVAGLASLVSYPALLAFGLPPLAANVTNTTAMTTVLAGSAVGSRRELRGTGRRLLLGSLCAGAGGALGSVLLLRLPASAFEAVVPWLVALGSALLLARDRVRAWAAARRPTPDHVGRAWPWGVAVAAVGVYAGYFGAAAGIIMLAVLSLRRTEPFAVTNAVKTIVTGAGNLVAAVVYVLVAPVEWSAVLALSVGLLAGSWLGPQVVRVLPERPLRVAVALGGFGLAGWLAVR